MRWNRSFGLAAAGFALAAALAGCSSATGQPGPTATAAATSQQIEDAAQLAMIRAHQTVALRLYEQGQGEKAVKHAGHPAEEIFFSLSRSMRSQDAALTAQLETSLRESKDLLLRGAPLAEVKASLEKGWNVLVAAEAALVPDNVRNTPAFHGAVISHLMGELKTEYSEAVVGGKLEMEIEYQDSWGALEVATQRFDAARADFGATTAEIAEHLDALHKDLPGVNPPKTVATTDAVNKELTAVQDDIARATK